MTAVAGPTPTPQHLVALARANTVRLARAELKRQVSAGETTVAAVLADVPWMAERMTIGELLMTQHRWGDHRVRRLLNSVPMTETKTVGSMTPRQRNQLIRLLTTPAPGSTGEAAAA